MTTSRPILTIGRQKTILALAPPSLPPEDKMLLEAPGYRFQALWINLPPRVDTLTVWHRYHGRADIENRIHELGPQFRDQGVDRSKYINYACSTGSFRLRKSENFLP